MDIAARMTARRHTRAANVILKGDEKTKENERIGLGRVPHCCVRTTDSVKDSIAAEGERNKALTREAPRPKEAERVASSKS